MAAIRTSPSNLLEDDRPIVCCLFGSLNPPTNGHMAMLGIAASEVIKRGRRFHGCLLVPTHDGYGKPGLAAGHHRLAMCQAFAKAASREFPCEVSDIDLRQDKWPTFVETLDRLKEESPDRRFVIVCGTDLIQGMADPKIWDADHVAQFVSDHGVIVVDRNAADFHPAAHCPFLSALLHNILRCDDVPTEGISSTAVRRAVGAGRFISGVVLPEVAAYIHENGLYVKT